jgi:hypothetical protein
MSKGKLNPEQIIGVPETTRNHRTAAEDGARGRRFKHTVYAWKAQYSDMDVIEPLGRRRVNAGRGYSLE